MAMRLMGEQFVTAKPLLERWRMPKLEEGSLFLRYAGRAALTAADAQAYMVSYQQRFMPSAKRLTRMR